MAVVMGETYPELFSAVGVHSGLPYKSASDVVSAFAAMRGDLQTPASSGSMRTIVFHGDADTTVVPLNAREILKGRSFSRERTHQGVSDVGRRYTRQVFEDQNGVSVAENWLVQGAGHAWAGGNPQGSFTDEAGPDASKEMLRFFLSQVISARPAKPFETIWAFAALGHLVAPVAGNGADLALGSSHHNGHVGMAEKCQITRSRGLYDSSSPVVVPSGH